MNLSNPTTSLVLYIAVFFGIMYFLMIRPQQKQQKARQNLLSNLRVKDKVITSGGIYGKIIKVKEDSVLLQIAEKVEVEVAKSGITSVENRKVEDEEPKNKKTKNEPGEEKEVDEKKAD